MTALQALAQHERMLNGPVESSGAHTASNFFARLGAPFCGVVAVAACCASTATAPAAEIVGDLYQATVFVTGQGEETRGPALGRALSAVLVKVSTDPQLATDPAVVALGDKAADFVEGFAYRDLMEGIPVHDEQGSRDRPYHLTVVFAPEEIDRALASLGSAPWTGPRPKLLMAVAVRNGDTAFTLAADGAKGRDMREAIAAAAEQYGMPVTLPTEAALAEAGIATDGYAADGAALDARFTGSPEVVVAGALTWSDADLGWEADWQMTVDDVPYRWTTHRVSFDDAFRAAVGGAARILSGRGAPE